MKPEENDKEILRKLSPTLFERKQAVDDAPPEGYFDALPDQVMGQIESEEKPTAKQPRFRYINIRNIAIAAGIAIVLALIPFFKSYFGENRNQVATTRNTPTPNISPSIENSAIDDDVLATYLSENDLYTALSAEDETVALPLSNTDSDAVIEYLMDENVSDQIIIETLNTEDS